MTTEASHQAVYTYRGDGFSVALRDLASVVRGEIVTPADPGWDDARQPWDLVDQRPAG
jgi:hypothetical protein